MPRGGEFYDGPTVQSDNAIESSENKITGVPKGDSDVRHFQHEQSFLKICYHRKSLHG